MSGASNAERTSLSGREATPERRSSKRGRGLGAVNRPRYLPRQSSQAVAISIHFATVGHCPSESESARAVKTHASAPSASAAGPVAQRMTRTRTGPSMRRFGSKLAQESLYSFSELGVFVSRGRPSVAAGPVSRWPAKRARTFQHLDPRLSAQFESKSSVSGLASATLIALYPRSKTKQSLSQ